MDLKKSPFEGSSWDEDDVWERKQASLDEMIARYARLIKQAFLDKTAGFDKLPMLDLIRKDILEGKQASLDEMIASYARLTVGPFPPFRRRTIKVQALNGETCTVEAYRFDRAKDVKAKACEKLRLSTERRTLVYNGKELDDMSDLSSIDTSVECKFQLLPKTGLGLVDSVKSLFEYFRNGAHRLVEWFPDFFMDMSRALTEKDLSRISQAIGSGWKHLGAELGISQAEIDQICEDNRKTSMKIFNMLRQWSIQASVNATVNTLHNAMKNCRKVTFDMKAIERVFAGI